MFYSYTDSMQNRNDSRSRLFGPQTQNKHQTLDREAKRNTHQHAMYIATLQWLFFLVALPCLSMSSVFWEGLILERVLAWAEYFYI